MVGGFGLYKGSADRKRIQVDVSSYNAFRISLEQYDRFVM